MTRIALQEYGISQMDVDLGFDSPFYRQRFRFGPDVMYVDPL
jgi:hypothetical protein